MKGRYGWLACIAGICAVLGAPCAQADGGRITFSGRIVEATCATGADLQAQTAQPTTVKRNECGSGGTISYSSSRVALLGDEPDRVLRYFSDYMHAARVDAQPTLVLRVYE